MSDPAAPPPAAPPPAAPPAGDPPSRSLVPDPGTPPANQPAGNPPVVGETWWKGWIRDDGSLEKGRLRHLPDELKGSEKILNRFEKADDFFKSFAHAQRLVSEKGLTPLREGATAEEQAEHIKRLASVTGAPEKWESYGITKPEGIPDEKWDGKLVEQIGPIFHKHAASPGLVKEVVETFNKHQQALDQEAADQFARDEDAHFAEQEKIIKREFGPFAKGKFEAARSGARWMGIDLDQSAYKTDAAFIIAAAKVGEKIGEARHIAGDPTTNLGGMSPQDQLSDMVNNPANPYYEALRSPHKNPRLTKEAQNLQRRLGQAIAKQTGG